MWHMSETTNSSYAAVCGFFFFNKVSMAYRIYTQAGPVSTKSNLEAKANYKSSGWAFNMCLYFAEVADKHKNQIPAHGKICDSCHF